MYYEVHLDQVFFTNFVLNLWVLSLFRKLIQCSATHCSVFLGAAGGAVCEAAVILVLPLPMGWKLAISGILAHIFLVRIGLRITKFYYILRTCGYMVLVEFLFLGILNYLEDCFNLIAPFQMNALLLMSILGVLCLGCHWCYERNQLAKKKLLYEVEMECNGVSVKVRAFLDTGNGLYEPIYKNPVSIIEQETAALWKPYENRKGFCVIPYHSIGKDGMLTGFLVENVRIRGIRGEKKIQTMLVGVCGRKLSTKNQYQMILHPAILENEKGMGMI